MMVYPAIFWPLGTNLHCGTATFLNNVHSFCASPYSAPCNLCRISDWLSAVSTLKRTAAQVRICNTGRGYLLSVAIVKSFMHQRGNVYQQRTSPLSAVFSEIHSGTNSCSNLSCSSISPVNLLVEN
jgi:hypothetical protein